MFDCQHYVPVLRWKRAERRALRELFTKDKSRITPIIEIIPENFQPTKTIRNDDDAIEKIVKEFYQNWGNDPFFLDLSIIDTRVSSSKAYFFLEKLAQLLRNQKLAMIPVIGLENNTNYKSAVLHISKIDQRGVCFRFTVDMVRNPSFQTDITNLMQLLKLPFKYVDVVLDYKAVNDCNPIVDLEKLIQIMPYIKEWRTFTIISGAFPKDLSELEKNRQHLIPREDWMMWRSVASKNLPRTPTYGDYTIQYGKYKKPPDFPNTSASIRYTLEEEWLIMRGEGLRNPDGPRHQQYPAQAMLLCQKNEFFGANFSYGDKYIESKGKQLANTGIVSKTGSPETWLCAGINHHLTVVAHQVSNLFATSTALKL